MRIPESRGPLSNALFALLAQAPAEAGTGLDGLYHLAARQVAGTSDIIGDEDIQLALFCLMSSTIPAWPASPTTGSGSRR